MTFRECLNEVFNIELSTDEKLSALYDVAEQRKGEAALWKHMLKSTGQTEDELSSTDEYLSSLLDDEIDDAYKAMKKYV